MNWNQALFPSLKRRGGCAIKKMSRSNLSSRRRGGQIGEIFRPEEFRRTDHPVCGASEASRLFINAAATPPFQGGECVRTETVVLSHQKISAGSAALSLRATRAAENAHISAVRMYT